MDGRQLSSAVPFLPIKHSNGALMKLRGNKSISALSVLAMIMILSGCEGGANVSSENSAAALSETATASFSVTWQERPFIPSAVAAGLEKGAVDCAGVETIHCDVYDESDILIATGGPWSCADGGGHIEGIPAGSGRKFVVLGQNTEGAIAYRGQIEDALIEPRKVNSLGTINAYPFVPQLIRPEDGQEVAADSFSFAWEYIKNAETYHLLIAQDEAFVTEVKDFTAQQPEPENPNDPDPGYVEWRTGSLSTDTEYFWKVYAIDVFGNESADSESRKFTIRIEDQNAPSAPGGVVARTLSASRIDLSWQNSIDNVAVQGYRVYRVGIPEPIAETSSATTNYTVTGLKPATRYCFAVSAFDSAGNESAQSDRQCARTPKNDDDDGD